MYTVTVRDRVMIAHSLRGEVFGPAQGLHGATYVVDATFRGADLDGDGVLVDIGAATSELREVLSAYDYRNLDDHPNFTGRNSTTEVLAKAIADALADRIRAGRFGEVGDRVASIAVSLRESDIAWASYERTP